MPFGTAARTWFAISLQTFGGPAGQIAVMQRTAVAGIVLAGFGPQRAILVGSAAVLAAALFVITADAPKTERVVRPAS